MLVLVRHPLKHLKRPHHGGLAAEPPAVVTQRHQRSIQRKLQVGSARLLDRKVNRAGSDLGWLDQRAVANGFAGWGAGEGIAFAGNLSGQLHPGREMPLSLAVYGGSHDD